MAWVHSTGTFYNDYAEGTDALVIAWSPNYQFSSIPTDLQDEVEPISGEPKGAKYLISYAFKKSKDPVVFLKDEKDMKKYLEDLMANDRVDQKTIMIHEIRKQFRPKKTIIKKETLVLKEVK